jgi:predicted N-acetyltransferase YhbS
MKDVDIGELQWNDPLALEAARTLIVRVFAEPQLYSAERIGRELQPAPPPLQRRFFAAWREGQVVGAGGLKSADWASNTHLLYLSVVAPEFRGRGIGRALVVARLAWLRARHEHGRVLVSTAKPKRFLNLGFRQVNRREIDDKCLMFLEF